MDINNAVGLVAWGDFQFILARCKCEFALEVNRHRSCYEIVEKYMRDKECFNNDKPVVGPEMLAKMIETDTIVELQFYPDTPIGFYKVYHWDVALALREGRRMLEEGDPK